MVSLKKKTRVCDSCGKLMSGTDLRKNTFLFKCSNCGKQISIKMGKKKKK
jgi:predicted RNA-binding Zn-ribbon protein involved in translation (DUF1610 family)